jgi:polyhydroxybutyrate depolymerase
MRRRRLIGALAGAAAALILGGVPRARANPLPPGTTERKLKVADGTRSYLLHVPPGPAPTKPVPLVIVLHGALADGETTEVLTGFDRVADKNGFAVAYPNGLARLWLYTPHSYDVAFIDSLVSSLVAEKVADPRRVYATGISNGGLLSNRLGIDLSKKLAAIAPVSGTIPRVFAEHEKAGRPMPVLYFHGTEDKIVGYDGTDFLTKKESLLGAEDLVAWWAKRNGCGTEPKVEKLTNDAGAPTSVERWTYEPGSTKAEVVLVKMVGAGHTWPGGSWQPERLLGKVCRQVDASQEIWDFFAKHSLPEFR